MFIEIASRYPIAIKESYAHNPLAQLIRDKPREILSPILNDGELIIEGSAGKGRWTPYPWIAIINKNETDGAMEGIYVVYLFSKDMRRIYLTFNQGITRPILREGRKIAFLKLGANAIGIRTNFPLSDFESDDKIRLGSSGLGAGYEKATIFYKKYYSNKLPTNDLLINDLKKLISVYNNYLLNSNVLTTGTDFSEYEGGVEEGRRVLKNHKVRERNPKNIIEAKKRALKKYGELNCEICGFSFEKHYGNRAKDFIEGHHKKSISGRDEGGYTYVEDIVLVCSNCHSVIHLKMPWLNIDEVKNLIR